MQDKMYQEEENATLEIIRALEAKIDHVEQIKKEIEEKQAQVERERIQEEKLKKQNEEKRIQKLRKVLSVRPGKLQWLKGFSLAEDRNSIKNTEEIE